MATQKPKTAIKPDEMAGRKRVAKITMDGTANISVVRKYLRLSDDIDSRDLISQLDRDAAAISAGDLSCLERMLLSQAVTLQSMFTDLALQASGRSDPATTQTLTQLALKSAAGSRQAIAVLADMRAPKLAVFAKQANVSSGPQQVNNVVPRARKKSRNSPNELLEDTHGQRLDTGAQSRRRRADQGAQALEPVDRAQNG